MAGIRTFNTNLPHVFRFPEWVAGITYPKGSIVAEETAQNGVVYNNYYVAIVDVQNPTAQPSTNGAEWNLVFEDPGYDSEIIALLTDSDFIQDIKNAAVAIPILQASIDSEMLERRSADSDLQVNMDSERHDWRAGDSDLYIALDSERHDWKAGDSDIYHRIRELDSDIAILFKRTDSDEDALQEIRTAVLQGLDSEIRARLAADSDLNVFIAQTVHDYLSNDSEHDSELNAIRVRIDSDFDGAIRKATFGTDDFNWGPKPFLTNTDYFIDEGLITNHIIGYLWVSDNTNDRIYVILNGNTVATETTGPGVANITTSFTDVNGIEWRRGAQIEESPGDDADVSIYQNQAAPTPLVTNANLYAVVQRYNNKATHVQQVDLDTAFRRTVTTVVEMDSDVNYLLTEFVRLDSDNDSDIRKLRHDIDGNDSDLFYLRKDVDSDSKVIQRLRNDIDSDKHDWQAADSDIYAYITAGIDSDIKLSLDHDSELFVKTDSEEKARRNADSDIFNGYTGISYRYIKTEQSNATFTGLPVVNFDGAGAVIAATGYKGGWFWNSYNDRLVITDSDGTILYNEIHNDEPILVEIDSDTRARRGTDTGLNADAQLVGVTQISDDLWNYRLEYIHQFKRYGGNPEGYLLETIIDSDLNLKDADSDNAKAMEFIGIWMQERDSDLKQETHDRKAVDSDIIAEFRIPEETITLTVGDSDYTLTNLLLNENTRWSYRTEIEANSSIYNGVVNDHFEIDHDGTAWTITLDGVQGREYTDIFVSGSATVSGQAIRLPWDDTSTVTISPLSTDSTADIATQLHTALLDKAVIATLDVGTSSVNYSADGRIAPTGVTTLNGISFTFFANPVVDEGYYYKDGDTITVRKK